MDIEIAPQKMGELMLLLEFFISTGTLVLDLSIHFGLWVVAFLRRAANIS